MKTLILLITMISCASNMNFYKNDSAAHIGCMPQDVKIEQHSGSTIVQTWVASCKEEKYFCRREPAGTYSRKTICSKLKQ